MREPEGRIPDSGLSLSMLISESVYRLIVCIERLIRWTGKTVRPYLFLFRCLLG